MEQRFHIGSDCQQNLLTIFSLDDVGAWKYIGSHIHLDVLGHTLDTNSKQIWKPFGGNEWSCSSKKIAVNNLVTTGSFHHFYGKFTQQISQRITLGHLHVASMTLYVRLSCDPWPLYSSCACSRVSAQSICTIRWDSNSQRTNLSKFHFRHVRNENCSIVTFRYNIYPIYIYVSPFNMSIWVISAVAVVFRYQRVHQVFYMSCLVCPRTTTASWIRSSA